MDKLDVPLWGCVVCANVYNAADNEAGFWAFFVGALVLAVIRFGRVT